MLNTQKHKTKMIKILKDIYSDTSLSSLLGFKGGTATYLFYNLSRFSTDLDFDLLKEDKKQEVIKKLKKILKKHGTITETKINKGFSNSISFILSYQKHLQNISIDISYREINKKNSYEIKNYLGISIKVMKKTDMFAHKLVALTDRKHITNRDIYDIWFFTDKDWDINKDIVKLRTNKNLSNYIDECIKIIQSVNQKNILQGIGDLFEEEENTETKKQWIKDNLKKETISNLKIYKETHT